MKIKISYTFKQKIKTSIINVKNTEKSALEFWEILTGFLASGFSNIRVNKYD